MQGEFFDLQHCMGRSAEVRAASPVAAAEVALKQMLDSGRMLIDGKIYTPSEATKKFLKSDR